MKKLETSFFLNRIYFSTRKCMLPTFSKNLPQDYTAALTIFLSKKKKKTCENIPELSVCLMDLGVSYFDKAEDYIVVNSINTTKYN